MSTICGTLSTFRLPGTLWPGQRQSGAWHVCLEQVERDCADTRRSEQNVNNRVSTRSPCFKEARFLVAGGVLKRIFVYFIGPCKCDYMYTLLLFNAADLSILRSVSSELSEVCLSSHLKLFVFQSCIHLIQHLITTSK